MIIHISVLLCLLLTHVALRTEIQREVNGIGTRSNTLHCVVEDKSGNPL